MTETYSDSALENYYRKEPEAAEQAIRSFLKETRKPRKIVHGTQALNASLPAWLDRETEDWDIFVDEDAKELAEKLEKRLDKRYGADFFSVEPALHEGTFRIRSKVTGSVVADISLRDREVEFKPIRGVNYATLEYLEDDAERILDTPEASFKHRQAKDTLQRISVLRKSRGKRRKKSGVPRGRKSSEIATLL